MWTIASLLSPKTATILQGEGSPREKVAVFGDNKLAIVRIVSKEVFYYTEKIFICRQ